MVSGFLFSQISSAQLIRVESCRKFYCVRPARTCPARPSRHEPPELAEVVAAAVRARTAGPQAPHMFATARYLAMLVLIDQITRANTPGKKPKPNKLSSPKPERTAAKVTRNDTAPMSATTPVQRAKTPLRRVTSPAGRRKAAKPMAERRKGPAEALAIARVTTGFALAPSVVALEMMTIAMVMPAMPVIAPANATRASSTEPEPCLPLPPDRPREVQKDEACEQHCECTDAALPLVVIRPVRPRLIRRTVVGRIATTGKPADQKQHREGDAQRAVAATWMGEAQATASPRQFVRTIGESFLNPQIAQ